MLDLSLYLRGAQMAASLFYPQREAFRYRRMIVVAILLMAMDAVIMGSPNFGLVVIGLLFFTAGIAALIFLFKNTQFSKLYALKALIYFLALVGLIGIFGVNTHRGYENASTIIEAVDAYHSETGSYPQHLQQLVPSYLGQIPTCSYTAECTFDYYSSPDYHSLMWSTVRPFGRPVYNFETANWGYLD